MRSWANLLFAFLLGGTAGVLLYKGVFLSKEITVYPMRTFENGAAVPIGIAVYRVDIQRQEVLWWRPGIADAPDRLSNCAIRDFDNWRCESAVAGDRSVVVMQHGQFEETVSAMHLKDQGVSRDTWERAKGEVKK